MKKIISLTLAIMLIFSLATTAFADEAELGSITINNVSANTTYEIYKLLDLESYDVKAGAYSYKANTDWAAFFATDDAKVYFTTDDAGYVTWTWKPAANETITEDDAAAAFAKIALAYAKNKNINTVKSSENDGDFAITDTTGKFSKLELGYYLVDSTAGALCGLTTTNPDASVNAKNGTPTVDKQVQEDLSGMWGDSNTADIGQVVNFMTIIHVAAGPENYVLHDSMSNGLTFMHDTTAKRGVTEIKHIDSKGKETTLKEGTEYSVKYTDTSCASKDCNHTEHVLEDNDCDFEIVFSSDYVKTLKPNERILVYYNAMLNRNAVIAGEGNTNEAKLEYGENHFTTTDKTSTKTFAIDIVKTDSGNMLIDGAKFRIYDALTGGNEIAVVKLMEADNVTPVLDANGNPKYRRARADETGVDIVVKDGIVTIAGFDNGVYYLEETEAPEGYNKLTARKEFTIADGSLTAIFNGDIYSTGSGVHVVNKTGSMLPETGGFGTMMFVTFGMFVVLGTGVLLVTKKRMSMIEE